MGRLVFIGCGLGDDRDLSRRALEALEACDDAVAEFYTSRPAGMEPGELVRRLQARTGTPIRVLSRRELEGGMQELVERAARGALAFLTAGDALSATTHQVLRAAALRAGVDVEIVHAASVVTAVPALAGLSDYKFGRSTTLVFPRGDYFPMSPYEVIAANRQQGWHTLVLLDLAVEDEGSPARFMTAPEAAGVLLEMARRRGAQGAAAPLAAEDTVVAVVRAGTSGVRVFAAALEDMHGMDLGPPLHALVVPGSLSDAERDALAAAVASSQR